ncbi:ABC transporter ATP-binding protein [Ammoniphilus oxalaticus]|uniref:ABC transporter ATP-binding protein n=1 Tax=Ammoniphilus oxalaticus TaxID=66863 RepID=A0A419SJQ7_9BACL|nr:ABC transporter ATP-binding protein [Ammoniphilus oxalaticus]RKD24128.1 ABC transporter ATP-binding protein [Ammoniphilus oxalaticus]
MSEITLSVNNLRKSIGKKEIIRGISFELMKGEVFGFLGPNGAGKTTTIRMLVGLIRPTSGQIQICGFDLKRDFVKAMGRIGCIVENPELYPYISGIENLRHFARMIPGLPRSRPEEMIELVGLQNRSDDLVKTYSLGMKQRLGIAQALLGRPSVLILDEPTNGLDPAGIREMRQFIQDLAKREGLTVLVSTHLLSEAQALCDRIAIMAKGELIHVGTADSLLAEQQKIVWRLQPIETGFAMLSEWTEAKRDGEFVVTAYEEQHVSLWNQRLVAAGVEVLEMSRKLPSLEDLFLELTEEGGTAIE